MGTKNQSMAAKRIQRKAAKKSGGKKLTPQQAAAKFDKKLESELFNNGALATLHKYQKQVKNTGLSGDAPTNKQVIETLVKGLNLVIPVHAVIEVASRLNKEGVIDFSEADVLNITAFDKAVVRIAEDVNAIQILIEEGQGFEQFADVYISFMETMIEVTRDSATAVFNNTIKPHQEVIEEYYKEHGEPGLDQMQLSMVFHDQRMQTVAPMYATLPVDLTEGLDLDQDPDTCLGGLDAQVGELLPADEDDIDEMLNADKAKDIN